MTDQIIKAVEAGIEELYGQSAPQGSVVLQETREGVRNEIAFRPGKRGSVGKWLSRKKHKGRDTQKD